MKLRFDLLFSILQYCRRLNGCAQRVSEMVYGLQSVYGLYVLIKLDATSHRACYP
jgi:hypothetical protein